MRIGRPAGAARTIMFEDQPVEAFDGDTVAAALLAAGYRTTTFTDVDRDARCGFCFVGRCADCLVEIDGRANQRACLVEVREGMQVRIQHGRGAVEGSAQS